MSLDVETIVAVSIMMAVFSAVAAVGTSLVLGAGFERLRAGFDVISKQTGFFSDAIHKLEKKMDVVDNQTGQVSRTITALEGKVTNVGEQANLFSDCMTKLERKIDIVDKQTGFFGDAIHKLEKQIDIIGAHEEVISRKLEEHSDTDLISTRKTEALVSQAENLLSQMSVLAGQMASKPKEEQVLQEAHLSMPNSLSNYVFTGQGGSVTYN